MKNRKNLPYMPLWIDDWMQSSGAGDCGDATRGIYIDLMCVLFKEKVRGTFTLHSKEMKWYYSRSKTQSALAKPNAEERLPYFVDFLVKKLRSSRSAILKALQELLYHECIVIVGDAMIQPRMYRDYGGKLLDEGGTDERLVLPGITDAKAEKECRKKGEKSGAKNASKKGAKKGSKKTHKKDTENDPQKPRARASHDIGSGSENNKEIDNGIIGGVGDEASIKEKMDEANPKDGNKPSEAVADGGAVNVSPEDGKTAREPEKGKSGASAGRGARGAMTSYPTLEEIQAYMDERAAQGKPFLYITAEGYLDACEQSGWTLKDGKPVRDWRARLRTFETYRKEHGDRPVSRQPAQPSPPPTPPPKPGDPVPATRQSKGKYKNKW